MRWMYTLCFFILYGNIFSAPINYTFTAVAGAYTANVAPTAVPGFCCGNDNITSAPIPIGFNFQFGCDTYTDFVVTENGWMTFDVNCWDFHNTNDLDNQVGSAPGIDRPIIAPLWDDLAMDVSSSTVNYKLTGSAPNRILTIEWSRMLWRWSAAAWGISFQVKLYETTNRIEFIYLRNGTATANLATPTASIGLAGLTIGDFYSLNGVGGAPTASQVTETSTLSSKPATGQIYRWDPNCGGLPIELLSFTAIKTKEGNFIEWSTATETNNDYFTIERSSDRFSFEELKKIDGATTSNQILHYSLKDQKPFNGTTYYRLRQTDTDGRYTYSQIIAVENSDGYFEVNNIYPQPAEETFTIALTSPDECIIDIYFSDIAGKTVMKISENISKGKNYISVEMSSLPKGIYSTQIVSRRGNYFSTYKVVKN